MPPPTWQDGDPCFERLPRRILVRIMRLLSERDQASVAATCRLGIKLARHATWNSANRFRKLSLRLSACTSGKTLNFSTKLNDSPRSKTVQLEKPVIRNASAELISMIIEYADPIDALNFGRTCKTYRTAFKTHMLSLTYRALNEFHLPPRRFMRAMLLTSSIIAGSVAANIVSGNRYEPSDLDIVTPASEETSMKSILRQEMGFRIIDEGVPTGMQGSLRMLYEYVKHGKSVRLWIASGENSTVPVMLTSTTFVMNFISPWGVYCAYPTLTLIQRGLVNRFTDDRDDSPGKTTFCRLSTGFDKYTERGVTFEVCDKPWQDNNRKHKCFVSPTCTHTMRSLYDNAGLHIDFPVQYEDGESLIAGRTRYDSSHTTIWSLGGQHCEVPGLYQKAFAQSKPLFIYVSLKDTSTRIYY
jgi:hypothetical protein